MCQYSSIQSHGSPWFHEEMPSGYALLGYDQYLFLPLLIMPMVPALWTSFSLEVDQDHELTCQATDDA